MSTRKRCIFCGAELRSSGDKGQAKSREHIVPRWLMKHLRINEMLIESKQVLTETKQIVNSRKHQLSSLVAGRVCVTCNSGWMSQLETEVGPVLRQVIADPRLLLTIQPQESRILARWTLKTAAVLNRASTHGDTDDLDCRPIPDEHLMQIMRGVMPDNIVVVAGAYAATLPFDWLQFAVWATPMSAAPLDAKDRNRSYKIAIGLNDLLLAVAYYPSAHYNYMAFHGTHLPLWKGKRGLALIDDSIGIDGPTVTDAPHLEDFLRGIFVVSDEWLTISSANASTSLVRLQRGVVREAARKLKIP